MRRVLIFSLNYHPFIGGAEIAIKEITDRIAPEDVEFHLIAYRFDSALPKQEQIGNVTVHRIGIGKKGMTLADSFKPIVYLGKILYVPLAAITAWRLHRQQRFNAAWAMMSYMVFPLALLRLAGTRIPYLLTLQEGDPFEHVFERKRIKLFIPLLAFGIKKAFAVQAISTFLLEWSRRLGFRGQGEVIPNGVDFEGFAQQISTDVTAQTKEWLGKKEGDVFLVTTSRLVHKNGIDTVIAALAHLPDHVHFVIFGEGPLEGALKAKVAALKLGDRVVFKGALPHEDIPAVLSACDIFIRPSRSEGMGNSFIEAMAAGLPVIATQEGGLSDFIFDAERNPGQTPTAWAVDPDHPEQVAHAVEKILAEPEAAAATVAHAHTRAESYGWSHIAPRIQKLLEEASASSGSVEQKVEEEGKREEAHPVDEPEMLSAPTPVQEHVSYDEDVIRVLIATPLYPPEPGGPATYARLLEEYLPGRGYEVSVVKFTAVRRYPKVIRHLIYFYMLWRKSGEADVVFALDPVSTGVPAALVARIRRIPFVLKVVGDYAWEQGRQRFGVRTSLDEFVYETQVPLPVSVLRKVQTWTACRAEVVIVPSDYLKRIIMAWGIPERVLRVVYNAAAQGEIGSVPKVVQQLPHPYAVSVGRLVPWKGMRRLIDAVAAVRKDNTPLSLVIIGNGPQREQLEAHARKTLGGAFVFTGALPPKDVRAVLNDADLFALNTSYEGLSHVLIEASQAGIPILTTDVGGNREVVHDGVDGLLVPYGDTVVFSQALTKLTHDRIMRTRLGAAARKNAERFSIDAMVEGTDTVLRSTI